jgi:hypothetical protein
MRFGSVSETMTVSSTNPVCLFKNGQDLVIDGIAQLACFSGLAGQFNNSRIHGKRSFRLVKRVKGTSRSLRAAMTILLECQPTYAGSWGVSIAQNWCNGRRCDRQALFFDIMALKADQHCSMFLLPQCGQRISPSS